MFFDLTQLFPVLCLCKIPVTKLNNRSTSDWTSDLLGKERSKLSERSLFRRQRVRGGGVRSNVVLYRPVGQRAWSAWQGAALSFTNQCVPYRANLHAFVTIDGTIVSNEQSLLYAAQV
ncbi:hypothetical protein M514_18410 [Trichuris suis]|uniref:Uncharacterized protein n=1 Tax=Trichuris suis TaxID=68888 RepID=A0A085NJ92_9BILA|nr:hypothetical protein M514_18410 [Trichuris suis]